VLELTIAIVSVRAFAIGRSGLRYAERLAGLTPPSGCSPRFG